MRLPRLDRRVSRPARTVGGAVPAWIAGGAVRRHGADAAEVVVLGRPAADEPSPPPRGASRPCSSTSGSALRTTAAGWQPWPVDCLLDRQPLVEHAREHPDERRADTGAARGAAASTGPPRRRRAWGGHALHALARDERPADEVGLTEHAVELEVEARKPVARAEPERRGQDADVARRVGGDDVRGVAVRSGPAASASSASGRRAGVSPRAAAAARGVGRHREPAARDDARPA